MKVEKLLGYAFTDPGLMQAALDIRSPKGQRLEWLGDRVLGLCLSLLLVEQHSGRSEAELSRALSRLVNNERLYGFGLLLDLPEMHLPRRARRMLSDMIEALYGAVALDGGMTAALKCARHMYGHLLVDPDASIWQRDPKTLLKEVCERQGVLEPEYATHQDGDVFAVTCVALGENATGRARTKQEAAMGAALEIISTLGLDERDRSGSAL